MSKLHKNKQYYSKTEWTVKKVGEEINDGLKILNGIDKNIITFFGSHKTSKEDKYYKHAELLAKKLGENNFAILSGGGPGIMHASNSGATKSKTESVGFTASLLPGELVEDKIFTKKRPFHFLFIRRFLMAIKSDALIFYPGGYGTLNELFEYLVLIQTGIVDKVPVICVGKEYWQGLLNWTEENVAEKDRLMKRKEDLSLIKIEDDINKIIKIIK